MFSSVLVELHGNQSYLVVAIDHANNIKLRILVVCIQDTCVPLLVVNVHLLLCTPMVDNKEMYLCTPQ
jgi:hypothetical protein